MKNITKLLLICIIILNSSIIYSQELSNAIKNEMIEFLIKEKQYTDDDLGLLLKDIQNEKGIVFWQSEVPFDCEIGIKLFYFGSSSSHAKIYAVMIKNNQESLFIGADLKQEAGENLIFNFIRFFNEEAIICFYEKIYPLIINDVYRFNNSIPSYRVKFYK